MWVNFHVFKKKKEKKKRNLSETVRPVNTYVGTNVKHLWFGLITSDSAVQLREKKKKRKETPTFNKVFTTRSHTKGQTSGQPAIRINQPLPLHIICTRSYTWYSIQGQSDIKEWTGLEWNIIPRRAENRKEWKEAGCKIYSGGPTVSQTTG